MFTHLKCKHTGTFFFNPIYPTIKYEDFPVHDRTNFYGDGEELPPPDAPAAWGKGFGMTYYIDEYLADNINT